VNASASRNASASGRIGIFGGTFDPPHIGHLVAAQDACVALFLDRLFFVPAAAPPHKIDARVSSVAVRLEMLRAAISGNTNFEVSTIELDRSGPSYTVDTLRQLRQEFPDATLYLLVGVDQVREFSSWRESDEVLRLAELVMLARGEAGADSPAGFVRHTVAVTRLDISSTLIRARVAQGHPIRYLVPDAVAEIIRREGIYSAK